MAEARKSFVSFPQEDHLHFCNVTLVSRSVLLTRGGDCPKNPRYTLLYTVPSWW
jgi:hypothetical protein